MSAGDSSNDAAADAAESNGFRGALRHHPIPGADLELLRRLTVAIVVGALFLAGFHHLNLVYSHKFFDVTGKAEWIWAPPSVLPGVNAAKRRTNTPAAAQKPGTVARTFDKLAENVAEVKDLSPLRDGRFDGELAKQNLRDAFAGIEDPPGRRRVDPLAFYATRNFDLPANRFYTHIKIAADPEYALYFNGHEIAGRRMGEERRLDVYDVTPLAKTGRNRIVVAVRSTNSYGGLILSVDLSSEAQNYVVTDSSWRIIPSLTPDLLQRDPDTYERPRLLGEPPIGRWNYLEPKELAIQPPPAAVTAPKTAFSFITALPEIRDASGTTIVVPRRERATAYDFGFVDGRLRLTRLHNLELPALVNVRFANAAEELRPIEGTVTPFVFAPGEATVADTEVRHFRFASVYGRPVKAEVLK